MTDPYKVLGVDRSADAATIRKAYKKLARQWHPDVNKDPKAEERFKQINAAYDVLGDDEKRKLYDEFGEASTRPGFDADQARAWKRGGGGGRAGGFGFDFGGGMDVDDLLGSLFGGGGGFGQAPRARRGADQQAEVEIPFLLTVTGGNHPVSLRRPDGRVETLNIPIPAGAKDGGRVRLKGQGLPPRGGGPCGDLIVQLKVAEHPVLRRISDDDLEMDVPITVREALVGGVITVPTPTGDVKVTVPPKVRSGARLRLKGRGVQRDRPGNLYLVLRPTVPESDDPEVLRAADVLEAAYASDVRQRLTI